LPSVQFNIKDLENLLGAKVPHDRDGLNKLVAYVKADVESIEEENDQTTVGIEIKDSNRPDIWCVEGVARALRGYLKLKQSKLASVQGSSGYSILIDKRLRSIRPYIACAIVRNIKPSEDALKSWISLQEKMDQTYGRKRRKASIGLYQADLIKSPIRYTVSSPDETSFIPLGSNTSMTLRQIIESHPKGIEYGQTIFRHKEWPLLIDKNDKILSLPPIINSNDLGKVTTETKNILIEVTGTSLETVHDTLKIVVTTLAERGGKIYSCTQKYPYTPTKTTTPDLKEQPFQVSLSYTNKLLGTSLQSKQATELLKRAGYPVRNSIGEKIIIGVPSYRIDIMHQVDVIEDIGIAMDINSLKTEWPGIFTVGGLSPATTKVDNIAELMVGLGYQEIMTYSLSSPETMAKKMNMAEDGLIELQNPSMTTYTILRSWLLPSLMEFLSNNTHVEYPQRIFEIGNCFTRDSSTPTGVKDIPKLAAITVHATAGFTEIRQSLDSLLRSLSVEYVVKPITHPSFLEGRTGQVVSKDLNIGMIGELNPRVVKTWGLSLPVGAFELDLSTLSNHN
jgi:phenylalanyl-tRNA synthetase beta chain